jgi:hypothetical protein
MGDVVAVEVRLGDGSSRFFLTWGRIQDQVDTGPVCELVLKAASRVRLGGEPASACPCDTFREAAVLDVAPYFYECFFEFSQETIPLGDHYAARKAEEAKAIESGRDIAYCGSP